MKIFTWKITATPRRREGPLRRRGSPRRKGLPRSRLLRLGEPGDSGGGYSGPPRQSVAHLGESLRLGRGRLHLGILVMVQGLCLRPVSSQSHGPLCDYHGLLRGPLCDLF